MIYGHPLVEQAPALKEKAVPRSITRFVGEFVVVETEESAFLGTLTVLDEEHVVIHTGFVGRPPVIAVTDIDAITMAEGHADIAA
jgi:hypothetical protein